MPCRSVLHSMPQGAANQRCVAIANLVGPLCPGVKTAAPLSVPTSMRLTETAKKGDSHGVTRGCLAAPKDRVRAVHAVELKHWRV
jgi:hypothetical protein